MRDQTDQYCRELLVSLRKIMQAVDLHSKDLKRKFGLTGPQLVILQEVASHGEISVSELAKSVSLSQATVTDIVNRLIKKQFLTKARSEKDKRRVMITPLRRCHDILELAPPLLQETFTRRFTSLEHWEQLMLLSALNRIVNMMPAAKIDAAPILATGPIDAPV
jgi:DNA-binding MarR family transcriptional regulator